MLSRILRNKYNRIIAVNLAVILAVVSSYVPDAFDKEKVKALNEASKQKIYKVEDVEEPELKVESANRIVSLAEKSEELSESKKTDRIDKVKDVEKVLDETKETINKEYEEAIKKTNSNVIIKRAEEYKSNLNKTINELDKDVLNIKRGIKNDVSDKETKKNIKNLNDDIKKLTKNTVNDTFNENDSHGKVDGYEVTGIVGEELPESRIFSKENIKKINDKSKDILLSGSNNDENSSIPSYLNLNDEIKKKADELETPVNIYEYVHNNYDFKPYTGLRLGCNGTYDQKAGNDYDQAALLIAMLKYKGYDAKFVMGYVDIDIEKAKAWLGVNTDDAAVQAMSMLGIPTQHGSYAGKTSIIRIEHVWVRTCVNYKTIEVLIEIMVRRCGSI